MSLNNGPGTIQESIADRSIISMDSRIDAAADPSTSTRPPRRLSTFERVFSTHAPIFESLLLQIPTDTIFQLYHTSSYLRNFLQSYPTAWKYLSFRLLYPSGSQTRPLLPGSPDPATQRQSRPYALDQLLMMVVVPLSPCLRSLELDNTAVSGQILISTVLHSRRETLEHLSVRGCKNVSLKYHIIPYLTMFGLQYDVDKEKKSPSTKKLALKSLYTYRCRHHRRRPYLSSSLLRRESDSEPTHELVNLCHKLGIWTDTAWCTTPAGRCFRRRGYVSMRVPHGSPEVWVVFDRLWRSKNWLGSSPENAGQEIRRDGRLWEHDETGFNGEPLGTGDGRGCGEGKTVPAHLRQSHRRFVENIKCDSCFEDIPERCEQCSVLMHCVGCRKTLCASCAYDRPYHRQTATNSSSTDTSTGTGNSLWWAPGATISPCIMQEPPSPEQAADNNPVPTGPNQYPALKFHWCCTEPIFSGGGGISIGTTSRDVDLVRAAPLPRGQGWEDPEYSRDEWYKNFPRYAYGDPKKPDYSLKTGHIEMMRWLLGPPTRQVSTCPRNLCQECYDSPQWKVHCKSCSRPLCMEHDLRGLRLRICGYRDLALEKMAMQSQQAGGRQPTSTRSRTNALSEFESRLQAHGSIPTDSPSSSIAGEHDADVLTEMHPAVLQEFIEQEDEDPLPDQQVGRSRSPTNSNLSRSSSRSSVYYDAAAEIPKWQGCQSFFCPQYRPVGDQRQRCTSVLRECTNCAIHVCQDCINNNPPCTCSYCEVNYLCPNCLRLRQEDGTCRRAEEEKAMKEEKWKRDMEMLEDILERKLANEVAEFAGQFMGLIQRGDRDWTDQAQAAAQAQTRTDVRAEEMFEHPTSDEEALLEEMMTPIAD
ncbi:hypothetical protein VTN77DRAFT_627 [Rasamsonia byssochlamydoides]|uniref:uncharacterized protein n=1 Tax=Rasamsonia byssochlamydoides TaxID=89139 RepID=UPI003743692D